MMSTAAVVSRASDWERGRHTQVTCMTFGFRTVSAREPRFIFHAGDAGGRPGRRELLRTKCSGAIMKGKFEHKSSGCSESDRLLFFHRPCLG